MRDLIVGIGAHKSIPQILAVADHELRRTRGAPRKIVVRGPGIEIQASRQGFEGEFPALVVRVKSQGKHADELRHLAEQSKGVFAVAEKDGMLEFLTTPAGDKGDKSAIARELIERLSATLRLPEVWRVRGDLFRVDRLSSETLFRAMIKFKASDVHMFPGSAPVFRVDNSTRHADSQDPLSSEQILAFIHEIAPEKDWKEFEDRRQCSFNFHQVGMGYSRVSAFIKADAPHCTMRFLPETIPSFDDLRIPRETMERLASLHFGLILVTGMTGSGKSTTVASLVDYINSHRSVHILTIEEPVEYVHNNKKAVVSQRDVGVDVHTFNEAVRGALRHDPDIIVIGEMRDPDTIRSAINAAATGHLVISTLHANTAAEVINRIVSFFDPVERDLVRLQLRDCVKCVMCQRLLRKAGGGRVPALEALFNDTKHIHDSILEGDTMGLRVGMQQTASDSWIFEDYLFKMMKDGIIKLDEALVHATDESIFQQMMLGTYVIPSVDSMKQSQAAH